MEATDALDSPIWQWYRNRLDRVVFSVKNWVVKDSLYNNRFCTNMQLTIRFSPVRKPLNIIWCRVDIRMLYEFKYYIAIVISIFIKSAHLINSEADSNSQRRSFKLKSQTLHWKFRDILHFFPLVHVDQHSSHDISCTLPYNQRFLRIPRAYHQFITKISNTKVTNDLIFSENRLSHLTA